MSESVSSDSELVLLAYDGSEGARDAVHRAAALLAPRRALVVNVWQSFARALLRAESKELVGPLRDAVEELQAEDAEVGRRTAAEGARLATEAGFEARDVAIEGPSSAWRALLEVAEREDAAVVVVGSRGLSRTQSALLGSASAGVVHHSRRPVLVVRSPAEQDGAGPLLFASDGSEPALAALRRGAPLLRPGAARVLSAWRSCRGISSAASLGLPAGVTAEAIERLDAEARTAAEQRAGEGAELLRELGFEPEPDALSADGGIAAALLAAAREHDAAALVVGSHGRGPVAAALLGSVSRKLLHGCPVPLLVVPPG